MCSATTCKAELAIFCSCVGILDSKAWRTTTRLRKLKLCWSGCSMVRMQHGQDAAWSGCSMVWMQHGRSHNRAVQGHCLQPGWVPGAGSQPGACGGLNCDFPKTRPNAHIVMFRSFEFFRLLLHIPWHFRTCLTLLNYHAPQSLLPLVARRLGLRDYGHLTARGKVDK